MSSVEAEHEHETSGGDQEQVEGAESTAQFQPVVVMPEVENVQTGEESEEAVYKQRSKLYRFAAATKEWKERGTGDVKLLKHRETGKIRILLRQEKTNKLVMNHLINPLVELRTNAGSDTSWVWSADDFADGELKLETFAIRFKNSEIAEAFKTAYDAARQTNSGDATPAAATEATEQKDA
eukprot:TRINITY_DN4050_c0_g1_i1.p2 TRINITY_DN4050_c0_g1~~TRINITY_DN4050_c0_g1_i1.p2  ORF type:complete len:181 (-),score=67.96 TRINITY_DN4050_c0_g1_i1:224-766(-)